MKTLWPAAEPHRPLVFLHLPKSAGTTLRQILLRQYGRRYSVALDGSTSRCEEFIKTPWEERQRVKLLHGHMPFGMHRYISQGATYVTLVRDPVERAFSHYRFALARRDHYLHERIRSEVLSPAEYVTSGLTTELDNGQVRLLAGPASSEVPFGLCDDELLNVALENMNHYFSVVGTPVYFDESILLMYRRLGWKRWPYYVPMNVSDSKNRTLSSGDRSVIERHNHLDRKLYEIVQDRLRSEIEDEGFLLTRMLDRFKRLNHAWSKLMKPVFEAERVGRRALVTAARVPHRRGR